MHQSSQATETLHNLLAGLDEAVTRPNRKELTLAVKDCLVQAIAGREAFIAEALLEPSEGDYARRLLHRHRDALYSVIVMVWGTKQGTPIHDHGGLWCVEAVYTGRIEVKSYDLQLEDENGRIEFRHATSVIAGIGEAGALIPPYDYHTITNPFDQTAASIHVYGGDMNWCNCYDEAEDGSYRRRRRALSFTGQ